MDARFPGLSHAHLDYHCDNGLASGTPKVAI